MKCNKAIIYSAATISLIICDFIIMVISAAIFSGHIIFLLVSGLKTLLGLFFVFFLRADVRHIVELIKAKFIISLLILLVHILVIIMSIIFPMNRLASYVLGVDPLALLAFWFYIKKLKVTASLATDHPLQIQIEEALIPKKFELKVLEAATNNFKSLIATSNYTTVFKGTLLNNKVVAILRFRSPKDEQRNPAFVNEIIAASHCKHDNILKLLGYCLAPHFNYIVFEYMTNHPLRHWIFSADTNRRRRLTVSHRYQIAVDVAKALDYLTTQSQCKNFLLDLIPNSILLDHYFRAKVTNFGLWTLIAQDNVTIENDISLNICALEKLPNKCSVYQYGVLLLQLVSGKKCWRFYQIGKILGILYLKLNEGKVMELVDSVSEITEVDEEKILDLFKVALMCVHNILENRPTMSHVVAMLVGQEPMPSVQEIFTSSIGQSSNNYAIPFVDSDSYSCMSDDEILYWSD